MKNLTRPQLRDCSDIPSPPSCVRPWLLLLLLLHDLYSANFEDRVRGAGVARWRTGEGEKVR